MSLGTPTYSWLNKSEIDIDFNNPDGMPTFTGFKGATQYGPPTLTKAGLVHKLGSLFTAVNTSGITQASFGCLFKCPTLSNTGHIFSQWDNFLPSGGESNVGISVVTGKMFFTKGIDAANFSSYRTDRNDLEDSTLHHLLATWKLPNVFQIFIDGVLEPSSLNVIGNGNTGWGNFQGAEFWINGRRDNQPEKSECLSYRHKIWLGVEATPAEAASESASELNNPPTVTVDSITQRSL